MIRVGRLMTRDVRTCHPEDTLADASRLMWDADVGCLPVTARSGHLVAMITDRDIAMSAWLSGRPLREQRVSDAMSRRLVTVQEEDEAGVLEDVMRTAQVHRVPVVDEVGFLRGIVTLNDLAHHLGDRNGPQSLVGEATRETDIPVGDQASNAAPRHDHDRPHAVLPHELSNTIERIRLAAGSRRAGHDLFDFHVRLL